MQSLRNRILCVDDDQDSCEMMEVLLEIWGYDVALAETAEEGLRLAQSEHFDLYLLDTHLPNTSGWDICKQICAAIGHAPVVFLSAAAFATDKQRGLQAGAVAYFTKPIDFDALESLLAQLLPRIPGKGHRKLLRSSGVVVDRVAITKQIN